MNHTQTLPDKYLYSNIPSPKNVRKNKNSCKNEQLNQTKNTMSINHMFNNSTRQQSIDKLLKINQEIWSTALSNEVGRLAQGVQDIEGNNVIDFITFSEVPKDRIVTYANMVCDIRPLKTKKFRVRLTVGITLDVKDFFPKVSWTNQSL